MLRILAPLQGILLLLLILSTYPSTVSILPSYPYFTFSEAVLQQSEFLTLKAAGEAFSYAYYKAVESDFDANEYSDDPNEEWDVPSWFSDPPGGSTANCVSQGGGMGCLVWNLSGGDDKNDPCPEVVPYTPNPPVTSKVRPDVNPNNVKGYFDTLVNELESNLADMGFSYGVSGSNCTINGKYNLDVSFTFNGGNGFLGKSESVSTTWNFTPETFTITETNAATCECDYGSGYVTVAEYNINDVYVRLRGKIGGEEILKESSSKPYIRYFAARTYNNPQDGSKLVDCRMVIK
jgi:hypothetical protein